MIAMTHVLLCHVCVQDEIKKQCSTADLKYVLDQCGQPFTGGPDTLQDRVCDLLMVTHMCMRMLCDARDALYRHDASCACCILPVWYSPSMSLM